MRHEWDPLRELAGVQDRMNKLFESALARTNFDQEGGIGSWTPVADIWETLDRIVLCMELPGLDLRDLDLRVEGDDLLVRGELRQDRDEPGIQFHRVERSYGPFVRKLALPGTADRDGVAAVYRHGVLTVTVPKRTEERARPIHVSVR